MFDIVISNKPLSRKDKEINLFDDFITLSKFNNLFNLFDKISNSPLQLLSISWFIVQLRRVVNKEDGSHLIHPCNL